MSKRPFTTTRHRGFSMLEAVISLTLLSIVMVSVGSAMIFAAQATPDDDSAVMAILQDHEVLAQIADDLSQAIYITEQAATSITIVVPDRTGDGIPDRLRYAWGGSAGKPLTYVINGSTPVTLSENVQTFDLSYDLREVTEQLPGAITEGPEILLSSDTSLSGAFDYSLTQSKSLGHRFTPALSAGAVACRVTRVQIRGCSSGAATGQMQVQIKDVYGNTPIDPLYADATLLESTLSSTADWVEIAFDASSPIAEGVEVALLLTEGSGSGTILKATTNALSTAPYIYSIDSGGTWGRDGLEGLVHRVYGVELSQGPTVEVSRTHIDAVTLSMQGASTSSFPVQRRARLHHSPEKLDRFWEADFSANPTDMDLDADGVTDWLYPPVGVPEAQRTGGIWSTSGTLQAQPAGLFDGVVTLEARMRSTTGDGLGIFGPYTGTGDDLRPMVVQLRQDDSGGQELIVYNSILYGNPIASVPVAQGWADIRLILIPAEDRLTIEVNGEIAGTVTLDHLVNDTIDRTFSVRPIGTDGEIDYIRAKVGGSYAEDSSGDGGLLGGVLNLLGL